MRFKAVIFDLDGTITVPSLDFGKIKKEIGLKDVSKPILEQMQFMSDAEKKRAEQIVLKHEKQAAQLSILNDGAKETMENHREMGMKIGILTRNIREHAELVADRHGLKFDAIADRFTGPVKPDPHGMFYICEKFGVLPSQALAVGDYLFDIISANSAGCVSVLYKSHKNADEFTKHARYSIDDLSELLNIVKNHKD